MNRCISIAIVLLSLAVSSFGQSASTVLSSLRIRGATSEGGDPKYNNYVPRLNSDGFLDVSFLPPDMYTNVYASIDDTGSKHDQELIDNLRTNMLDILDQQYMRFDGLAYAMYTNAVASAIASAKTDPEISKYSYDQHESTLNLYTNAVQVAVGKGARTEDECWQIGAGTNSIRGTLKFRNTVLVNTRGEVPEDSIKWAVPTNVLTTAVSNLNTQITAESNRVSKIEGLLTLGQTNLVMKSATKTWELVIDDNGNLTVREFNP